ncbi:MAG: stage 0 sporulation family protein [Dehalococcoidia bacterium]
MDDLVGVRFKEAGRIYYFTPGDLRLEVGEYVVVETARGLELGSVVVAPGQVIANEIEEDLKPVLRHATEDDVNKHAEWRGKERNATIVGREAAEAAGLPMRVISSDYNLDGSRLSIYFESDDRVDFRDLLRDLSEQLDTRVEMRQVGPRDRSKLVDGYGRCGERLCCSSWLTSFPTISIKMAKDQGLPLNPTKISGVCGRLLCCLIYEHDLYKEIRGSLPRVGQRVTTPFGDARVTQINTLKELITFQLEDMTTVVLPAAEVNYGTVVRPADEVPAMPRYVAIAENTPADQLLTVVDTPQQAAAFADGGYFDEPSEVAEEPILEPPDETIGGGFDEPDSEEQSAIGLLEDAIIEGAPEGEEAAAVEGEEANGTSEHSKRRRNRRRRGGRGRGR